MYLAQVTRYDILYVVKQLARAMSKPAKAHMGASKHLLCYLAGSTDFSNIYEQGGFRLSPFSDPKGRSTSSCIVRLIKALISL